MKQVEVKTKVYNNFDNNVGKYLLELFDLLGGYYMDVVFMKSSQKESLEDVLKIAQEEQEPIEIIEALKTIKNDFDEGVKFIIILNYQK